MDYFNKKAILYSEASNHFPWRILRSMEKKKFVSVLGVVKGKTALEYGAGTGFYSKVLIEENIASLTVVDASEEMLNNFVDSPNIFKICCFAEELNLKKKFDLIVSCGMLEFVKDPLPVLKNFHKHSKPETSLLVLLPRNSPFGWVYKLFHYINGNSISLFSYKKIRKIFRSEGFILEKVLSAGLFSFVVKFRIL